MQLQGSCPAAQWGRMQIIRGGVIRSHICIFDSCRCMQLVWFSRSAGMFIARASSVASGKETVTEQDGRGRMWHRDESRCQDGRRLRTGPRLDLRLACMAIEKPVRRTTEERGCSYRLRLMRSNEAYEGNNKLWWDRPVLEVETVEVELCHGSEAGKACANCATAPVWYVATGSRCPVLCWGLRWLLGEIP